jgi:hypothetical protein
VTFGIRSTILWPAIEAVASKGIVMKDAEMVAKNLERSPGCWFREDFQYLVNAA